MNNEINYGDTIKYTTKDGIEIIGEVTHIDDYRYTVSWKDVEKKYPDKDTYDIVTEGLDSTLCENAELVKKHPIYYMDDTKNKENK